MFNLLELITNTLADALKLIAQGLFDIAKSKWGRWKKQPEQAFNARLASTKGILRKRNHGFCLDGKRSQSEESSYRGALIIGGTGTGKTSTAIIPSILKMARQGHSFVIHDPSGEIYKSTSGYLKANRYSIRKLRYDGAIHSDAYNPLGRMRSHHHVVQIAHTLLTAHTDTAPADPFWTGQAQSLLAILLELLLYLDRRFRNMANVLHLLNVIQATPQRLLPLFIVHAPKRLQAEYKSFIALSDKVLSGTIATAKSSLSLFTNQEIARITASDTMALEAMRSYPMAIFIQNPIMSQRVFAPLTSLFFTQLFEILMQQISQDTDRSVFCIIDEGASFKVDWPLYLAQVRKYRVGVMLAVQSFEQLEEQYGEPDAQNIAANTYAKLYFTNQPQGTAERLSRLLGTFQLTEESGARHIRELMTPQEIRMMKKDKALLLCGNLPPMLAHLVPYYKSSLRKRILPPMNSQMQKRADAIPLLPI